MSNFQISDNNPEKWMKIALEEAHKALSENEIPIGAVLVKDNLLAAKNHNRTKQFSDPTAHCEKLVLSEVLKNEKYLYDYTLYVTVEPCPMCAGMIILARVGKVVYGCANPKAGFAGSLYNILLDKQLNHNPQLYSGILSDKCSDLLSAFFQQKRNSALSC